MSNSTNTALHDIHFELKATADTKTTTGATDDSYVCKNGSFLKDKDNHNVKTGSNLIPSNWQDVKDKVVGNYNMYWFDLARDVYNFCNQTYRPNCRAVYSEGATAVPTATPHVTPGIGKPLFIVPDTNHVFLFARPTTSTTSKIGGQYYVNNYVANQGNTKLYQDYAKSSPVGSTGKAVRLRMKDQETSSGNSVDQREWLQACSQCNPGYTLSEGKQKPKKVCKRWIKANRGGAFSYDSPSQHGRSKPHRLLGKIRYNDGGTLTAARPHFVPFGVANNNYWYIKDVDTSTYKFQPYNGSSSFWGPSGVKSRYSAAFKTNSDSLKDTTNLWDWFPLETHSHNAALVKAIDCKKSGTTGSDPDCNSTHYRLGVNRNAPTNDLNYVKSNLQEFKSTSNISADDIYCGYTAGNDNVAGTYTNDEAQKRWRSLFFQNIYYKDASDNRYNVDNDNWQLSLYPDVKTNITYYSQSDGSVLWDKDKYHGCVKCPPGTFVIDKGCQRCPNFQWSTPVRNQNQTCGIIQAEPTSKYTRDYGRVCGKATMSNEGNSWCGSGGKYGLRNCNASDGNSIETGSRDKHVCIQYDSNTNTFGSYHGIRKSDCSSEWSDNPNAWKQYNSTDTTTCFKCTCPNGTPVGPKMNPSIGASGCDREGQNKCKSCNKGYYLDSNDKQCKQCPPDTYQHVSNNTNDSNTSCISCGPGRHLPADKTQVSECVQNQCTCKKRDSSGNLTSQIVGTAATGPSCTSPGGNICANCDFNHYLDTNKQCQVCARTNNKPTVQYRSDKNTGGAETCLPVTDKWVTNFQKQCPSGLGWCVGYYASGYKTRNCNASDGNSIDLPSITKTNPKVKSDQHHVCIDPNHHGILNSDCSDERPWTETKKNTNKTCFKCTCPNGTPVGPKTGKASGKESEGCDHEGQHKCQSCDTGFHLVDRVGGDKTLRTQSECASKTGGCKCIANTCKCEIGGNTVGTPATGTNCTSHGSNICSSCITGHRLLDSGQCKKTYCNISAPNNGGMGNCSNVLNHGSECQPTCNDGYRLDRNNICDDGSLTSVSTCIANRCTCNNGTETNHQTNPKCKSNGETQCISCHAGYRLVDRDGGNDNSKQSRSNEYCKTNKCKCVPNICTCNNGTKATTTTTPKCLEHNKENCISCSGGFKLDTSNNKCIKTLDCIGGNNAPIQVKDNFCESCYFNHYLKNEKCIVCKKNAKGQPTVQYLSNKNKRGIETCLPVTDKWVTNFQSQCPSGLGWCVGYHASGYKTRNCNAKDGHNIELQSITKTNPKVKSDQHHVCLDPNHHGILNSDCSDERPWTETKKNTDKTCFKCKCSNGTPVGPKMGVGSNGCGQEGENHCKKCNGYYHLVDISEQKDDRQKTERSEKYCETNKCKCVKNVCSCPGGTPSPDGSCLKHGGEHCKICNPNRELDQTSSTSGHICRQWGGSCLNGKLIDKDKRRKNNHCGTCNAGYTINKKTTPPTCRTWDDKCLNGKPISKITDRTADGQCSSCNPGYHLVNKKCIKCIDGTYTSIITGFPTEYCSIPGIGETILTSTKKAEQTCSCPNGTGSRLDNCSTDLHTQKYKEAIKISGGTEIQITQPNNIVKVKGIKTPLSSTNSQSLIRILRDRHKQNKTQRLTCSSCNQDYHLKKNKCNPNICQCPSGCVKIIEDTGKTSAVLCNGKNLFWDKISGKCYNCIKSIEATKMIGLGVASKCSQHEEEACVICTKPGTWLNGGKCVPWSKCKPGQIQIKEGTNRSDRVCGSSGPCPKGQWESKAATATRLRVCKSVGVCRNGLLISPVNQKQTHHCQSCNPGYRLCENRVECEKSSNKPSLISDPDEKRRWLPYRDCVMNVCKCSNGTSVTGNPLSPNSSPKCTKNNQEMCEKCKPGFYLVKETDSKGNPKQRCVPWTECLNSEWIQQSGSQTQNRICKPCPQGTLNQNYSKNNNLLGKITDCKCNSGYEIPVKDDQGKITDLKCGCLNGTLQEIKTGEKDCVCNSGYHGGGKKNNKIKDMSKYKPYGDCMITNKCKCSNGVGATNIPCDLRSIKSINDKRVTNTSDRGECPFVNSRGNVWKPSMGPLSSPVNAGFKQSNKTCPQNDEELCESCFDGFELNKKSFVLKGKIIKAKTRCVPVNDPSPVSNQVKPTPKPSTQTKKKKQTDSIRVPQKKINTIQVNNATSQKFQQMIKYNQR